MHLPTTYLTEKSLIFFRVLPYILFAFVVIRVRVRNSVRNSVSNRVRVRVKDRVRVRVGGVGGALSSSSSSFVVASSSVGGSGGPGKMGERRHRAQEVYRRERVHP